MTITNIKDATLKIARDSQLYAMVSVFAAVLVLILENTQSIISHFDKDSGLNSGTTSQAIGESMDSLLQKFNELPYASSIGTALLFGFAAVALYIAYILVSNVFITARNEVVLEQGARDNKTKRYLVLRAFLKVAVAIGLALFFFYSFKAFIPSSTDMASEYIQSGFMNTDLGALLAGYTLLTLNFYALALAGVFGLRYLKSE